MNVLVVSNAYPSSSNLGGIFVKNQVEELRKLKINIVTVVRKRLDLWSYLPFLVGNLYCLFLKKYDLIHAHFGFHSALLAAVVKRKPLIITFHGSDALVVPLWNKLFFRIQKFVVSRSDYIIAVSNEVKNVLVSNFGAEPSKISVITCGVNTSFFAPMQKMDARKRLGIDNDKKVVLFVGLFTGIARHLKGIDIICECARRMPDITFIFVGRGSLKAGTDNCQVVGIYPNEQIPLWLNAADVFVLPSRSEGTPVVLLEALSCGVPVVASKVGGIPDLIKDGQTGFLVEPENVEMLEIKLRELLANSEKCKKMGQQSRNDMVKNYDNQEIAKRIKQVYEKVLNKPPLAAF